MVILVVMNDVLLVPVVVLVMMMRVCVYVCVHVNESCS